VREGITHTERDDESHVLRVSYPLSLTRNLWGGTIEFRCTRENSNTVVSVTGYSHDPVRRLRAISDEMLDELGRRVGNTP
jgi:hypothetical protein